MRALLLSLFALVLLPLAAQAQDYNTVLDIPEGATLVNLSATERVEVGQDLLIANLRYESENKDPKALQDAINKVMEAAVAKAKAVESVRLSTQQYHVYRYERPLNPNWEKTGEPPKLQESWRGQQGLELKGKEADDLLKLVGELQKLGLVINGLSYVISPELLEETQNSLLEAALSKLKTKAQRTAKALGKSKADLLQVNVDMGGYYPPQPMMGRAAMMDTGMAKAEMAAPVAAPGQTDITLTVSAQALLRP